MNRAGWKAQPTIPDGHIDVVQAAALLVVFDIAKAFLVFPERMARSAETAAWSVPLMSAALSALWLVPLVYVLKAHPRRNLVEITRERAGGFLAVVFGILYYGVVVGLIATGANEIGGALTMSVLPLTPPYVLRLAGFGAALYVASRGTEVFSRTCAAVAPFIILMVVALLLLSSPSWHLVNFTPLLGPGLKQLLATFLVRQAIYFELTGLGFVAVYLRNVEDTGRVAFISTVVSAVVLGIVVTAIQLVLPYPYLERQTAPFLRIARDVYLGRFFQRFEVVFIPAWLSNGVLDLAAGTYVGGLVLASVVKVGNYKVLSALTAVIAVTVSLLTPNVATAIVADFDIIRPYDVPFIYVWLVVLTVLTWLHGRTRKGKELPQ